MASYSYKCNDCETEFTIYKGMNEEVKVFCEKCESEDIERIYSVPSFKIKCDGFCGKIGK